MSAEKSIVQNKLESTLSIIYNLKFILNLLKGSLESSLRSITAAAQLFDCRMQYTRMKIKVTL